MRYLHTKLYIKRVIHNSVVTELNGNNHVRFRRVSKLSVVVCVLISFKITQSAYKTCKNIVITYSIQLLASNRFNVPHVLVLFNATF